MRKILGGVLSAMFLINLGYAANTTVAPKVSRDMSCVPVKVKSVEQNMLIENANAANAPEVYLLKNTSTKSLWLDHPQNKHSASAGWSSYLRPENGSAILLDKKDFALSCSVISPGKVISVKCTDAISVCVAKSVKISSHRKGSYWLVEDKPWKELQKFIAKKSA